MVEYGKEPEALCGIRIIRADEAGVGLKPERRTRFSDSPATRDGESIVLLDLRALDAGDGVADGTEVILG